MKEILSASQMQKCDKNTIEGHGVPSLVLMERAAIGVVVDILTDFHEAKDFYVVCGPGNNGGDGVAVARLLYLKKKNVSVTVLGDREKFAKQLKEEIKIAESYGVSIAYEISESAVEQADVVVDAMFGIGLTRGLSNVFEYAAALINENAKAVVAVDIPSGYDADSGKALGEAAIKADLTVTFAYMKKGLVLGDCKSAAGKVHVADVGIYVSPEDDDFKNYSHIIDDSVFTLIPKRAVDANKGTCGKLLVIAGSEGIYGACYLAAKAALCAGTGLVKIYTNVNNVTSIQQALPEAMYTGYDHFDKAELNEQLKWADTILIGPGLGMGDISKNILEHVLLMADVPVVIDADGINLAAKNMDLLKGLCKKVPVIITPHLKEMERLTGVPVKEINYSMEKVAKDVASDLGCIVVLKNFTTIVSDKNFAGYCISGNEALATPGSGDVLAGIIASLLGQKVNPFIAAAAGSHLHGKAGENLAERLGTRAVLASDIIDEIKNIKIL